MTASRTLRFLRTTRGQLTVLGVAYGGAALLAAVAVAFFTDWFDSGVYEKFQTAPSERLKKLAADVAAGRHDATAAKELSDAELLQVYAVCIDEPDVDPQHRLAAALWRFHGDRLLERIRRTLVVGNPKQRLKALEILGTMPAHRDRMPARRLCEFTFRRSRRCGETDIADRASALLRRLDRLP